VRRIDPGMCCACRIVPCWEYRTLSLSPPSSQTSKGYQVETSNKRGLFIRSNYTMLVIQQLTHIKHCSQNAPPLMIELKYSTVMLTMV
jgi:hypothetical protein